MDIKKIRMSFITSMLKLKTFGFENSDPEMNTQGLTVAGQPQTAFSWDAKDALIIEYVIPLQILGKPSALNQKIVSIGWKVNGIDLTQLPAAGGRGPRPGVSTGGRAPGGAGGPGGAGSTNADMLKEQSFWTKYTFNMEEEKKAF